jgi:alkylhydroperoxidase family enzyme
METLTKHAYRLTEEQVEELRVLDWSEEQIVEAVFLGAFVNFRGRLMDAHVWRFD